MNGLESVEWIFFDVGYTLLDETAAWQEQFQGLERVLAATGRPASVDVIWETFRTACRDFAPKQWQAVCAAFAVGDTEVAELMTLAADWRHDLEVPHAGAKETLATLSKTFKLGVIANQSHGTRDRLRKHGLLDSISLVVGSAEAGVSKPDPQIFREALREAHCDPKNAAMVGDRIDNDIRPANLLGMKSVHVRQGGSGAQRPREASEIATATVETVVDVAALFLVPSPGTPGAG